MTSRIETGLSPAAPLPREHDAIPRSTRAALTLQSFGFKYGRPAANHVFDVSFLKNPAREEGWSLWSSPDGAMGDWVLSQPMAVQFLDTVVPLVQMLAATDDDVRIAFGCSAGRHRSTILVEEIARRLRSLGFECAVEHREKVSR